MTFSRDMPCLSKCDGAGTVLDGLRFVSPNLCIKTSTFIIVGDFNTPLSTMDRSSIQKSTRIEWQEKKKTKPSVL